jgi:hypothetical protein
MEIGAGRTASGNAYIDLIADTTYPDYAFRILRNSGANGITNMFSRGTGNFQIATNEAAAIIFATAAVERLRVLSGGSVTIGNIAATGSMLQVNGSVAIGYSASTTAPTNGLAVAGGVTIGTATANVSSIVTSGHSLTGANAQSLLDLAGTWNTTGNPIAIKLNITNTASGSTSNLMDLQIASSSKFLVAKTGNVGIGASTPPQLLSLYKASGDTYVSITSNITDFLVGVDSAGLLRLFTSGANSMSFWTNSTERMRIKSNGVLNISNIPTSTAGLSAGDVYSLAGTLMIV